MKISWFFRTGDKNENQRCFYVLKLNGEKMPRWFFSKVQRLFVEALNDIVALQNSAFAGRQQFFIASVEIVARYGETSDLEKRKREIV